MGSFSVVELQSAANAFEHGLGDAFGVTSLESDVVLDAHPGHKGDFLPAQTWHTAASTEIGHANLFRGEPGTPADQELTEVIRGVHVFEFTPSARS
ncbi:hypothetical protein [Arthrobacter sp. YD4]|uniref:hypothetical protein n=1 Tax=Arthrobacter sp. YD4 TaxID=3058043 RepID=UPI00339DB098